MQYKVKSRDSLASEGKGRNLESRVEYSLNELAQEGYELAFIDSKEEHTTLYVFTKLVKQ